MPRRPERPECADPEMATLLNTPTERLTETQHDAVYEWRRKHGANAMEIPRERWGAYGDWLLDGVWFAVACEEGGCRNWGCPGCKFEDQAKDGINGVCPLSDAGKTMFPSIQTAR